MRAQPQSADGPHTLCASKGCDSFLNNHRCLVHKFDNPLSDIYKVLVGAIVELYDIEVVGVYG